MKLAHVRKPFAQDVFDLLDEHSFKLRQVAGFHRLLRSRNDRPIVDAAGFQPGIGSAFAGAVQPYDRFHESLIRENFRIRAEPAYLPRLFKGRTKISASAVAGT